MGEKSNPTICACYERDCSGESQATENIVKKPQAKNIVVTLFGSERLTYSGFFSYFVAITKSLGYWITIIARNRTRDWIYTTTFTAGFAAALLKPFAKYQICFHYHGSRMPTKSAGNNVLKRLAHRLTYESVRALHDLFFSCVAAIIVPSTQSQEELVSEFPKLKGKRIVCIPNGVDRHRFKPMAAKHTLPLRKKYEIQMDRKVLMSIGILNPRKRLTLLLEALASVKKKVPQILLLIVHFPPRAREEVRYKLLLGRKIKQLGLGQHVVWISGEKRLPHLYNLSDMVIIVSRNEHFPLVMLEALATKTLFIGTPSGAVAELISKIDPRLLVSQERPQDIARQIESLLQLPVSERKKMLEKGYRLATQYSWENTSRMIYKLLSF